MKVGVKVRARIRLDVRSMVVGRVKSSVQVMGRVQAMGRVRAMVAVRARAQRSDYGCVCR